MAAEQGNRLTEHQGGGGGFLLRKLGGGSHHHRPQAILDGHPQPPGAEDGVPEV